jgi:hypothetical protein
MGNFVPAFKLALVEVVITPNTPANHPVSKKQVIFGLLVLANLGFLCPAFVLPLESLNYLLGISNIVVVSRHDAPFRGTKMTPIGSGPKPHLANTF